MTRKQDEIALIKKLIKQKQLLSYEAKSGLLKTKHKFLVPSVYRDAFGDEAAKYIVLKGGRGSGKTFAIVCHLIEESFDEKYEKSLFLFLREIQTSIEDSVYSVVVDLIGQANLSQYFKVTNNKITNTLTGVEFAFTGLRSTGGKTAFSQVNKIKGKHKVRYVFMDEAQDASEDSLNVLFPTVNRSGRVKFEPEYQKVLDALLGEQDLDVAESRFLFAMNPNFAEDPVIAKIRTYGAAARILTVNIFDLPEEFRDKQLLEQAEAERGEIYFDHVWLGAPSPKISGYPFIDVPLVDAAEGESIPCIAFLDPSFKGGDYTALSFIAVHNGTVFAWGRCWHQSWNVALDEIAAELAKHDVYEFWYEDNGLGSVPQELFAEVGVDAIPRTTLGNKFDRIFKVGAFIRDRMQFIQNWSNQAWLEQCRKFNEEAANDDAPDSLTNAAIRAGVVSDKMKFKAA